MAKVKHKPLMERALELAWRGFGEVEPNPMVGCVIVKGGQVIGEGWHKKFGGPHAEINALEDCRRNGNDPTGGTMLVTLEPCSHHGKTGPCCEAVINAGVSKVYVAMEDPSDKVAGEGVRAMREAGLEVKVGLCEKQAKLLNPGFLKYSRTGLPWVVLKWAQTIDGKLAGSTVEQRWITGDKSLKDVHKLRRSCQGILVGVNTVIEDDPLLTARPAKDKQLLRVVLDGELKMPLECKLVNTADEGEVWVIAGKKSYEKKKDKVTLLEARGANVIVVDEDEKGVCDIGEVLAILGKAGVQRLLVEGGVTVLHSFLDYGAADELNIYVAPKIYAREGTADIARAVTQLHQSVEVKDVQAGLYGDDYKVKAIVNKEF